MYQYWAISLDEWAEESFQWLGSHQDGKAGHYAVYIGTKEQAIEKCLSELRPLVARMLYESDDYGHEKELVHNAAGVFQAMAMGFPDA